MTEMNKGGTGGGGWEGDLLSEGLHRQQLSRNIFETGKPGVNSKVCVW